MKEQRLMGQPSRPSLCFGLVLVLIPIPDAQAADCAGLDSVPERIISFMVVSFYCTILHGVVCEREKVSKQKKRWEEERIMPTT